ncbi:MAG TPA: DUF3179 domain-containing protein [Nitrospirales bacterium]|nr:DUF3179 domain-containing protein [Nitrospirales bacterium]HIO21769.1 DUF3179 domain-containing protein [Nitrospirales bacterium]
MEIRQPPHKTGTSSNNISDQPYQTIRRCGIPWKIIITPLLVLAVGVGMTVGLAQTQPGDNVQTTDTTLVSGLVNPMLTVDDRSGRLKRITQSWKTDWTRHTIRYDEILSGGPPRDGIRSIDKPKFIAADLAASFLDNTEPVVVVDIEGDARAYPLQILMWHEIVNDTVGGVPVIVTFCPLCNSAIAFDRRFDGKTHEFGTSGLLRYSDLIMYDRTTESLWQQFTGEGVVGEKAGAYLRFLPASLVSFAEFRAAYPKGVVLSRDTGAMRSYGNNPYKGYDTIGNTPFMFRGPLDDRLPAMARVVSVSLAGIDIAYPVSILAERGVIHDGQAGPALVIFHTTGTNSALGASRIAEGEDVGATGIFEAKLGTQILSFHRKDNTIIDTETKSTWNILGHAIDGPLKGQRLTPIVHGDHFWFSWAAFKPKTILYQSG